MAEISASTIATNATKPQEAQGDQGRVKQHSLLDQIEADKYNRAQSIRSSSKLPIRLAKIKPGGAP